MLCQSLRAIAGCAAALLIHGATFGRAAATSMPPRAALVMPVTSLQEIALDFDAGRNVIYCYYGTAAESSPQVRVDSLATISSASECGGIGVGVISRIGDVPTLMAMLRGLIDAHPEFRVVSAFYKTELIEVDGQLVRAAHALSVVRAPSLDTAAERLGEKSRRVRDSRTGEKRRCRSEVAHDRCHIAAHFDRGCFHSGVAPLIRADVRDNGRRHR